MHASNGSESSAKCHPKNSVEPIAVVGISFRFPGGCETEDSFWNTLLEKRSTATEFPEHRLSANAIHHPQSNRRGTLPFRGGHFLDGDVAEFDAPFFSISATEAASMDPQQRGLLETTFRALENAGQPLDRSIGSNTSVYTGCFTNDWQNLTLKDSEECTNQAGVGVESSFLANRLSWFFNFRGTSFNVDSACSSSLVCVDLACKSLVSGESDMSIAAGCNLIFYPDIMLVLSSLGLLSPDNQCYSFDDRANGYARGEGFAVLVLKRLSDALQSNDVIRAVIRASGSNHDGCSSGLTQPSAEAQIDLIRKTYATSGLSPKETRLFEAHGTGTATGDPIEANAIGEVFRHSRSEIDPLFIGAVKSNIGHLEGGSGIAGVIKCILALERGIIPPNANFENINPEIDPGFLRIQFPTSPTKWPTEGLRRASVNSFGLGGTNAHVVLDDALNYLRDHGIRGNHNTVDYGHKKLHDVKMNGISTNGAYATELLTNGYHNHSEPHSDHQFESSDSGCKLLVLSAADKETLQALGEKYAVYASNYSKTVISQSSFLRNLVYTTSERRTHFPWRTAAVIKSIDDITNLKMQPSTSMRALSEPSLCLVFTGQGAQYPGYQLQCLEAFGPYKKSLMQAERYLQSIGCHWALRAELYKDEENSKIHDPSYSQPLSTALQVALIDLLRTYNIRPQVVVGHSSGEFAAAYCVGAIDAESAWRLAFLRGKYAKELADSSNVLGAMIAVGLSQDDVFPYLKSVNMSIENGALTVACINSPNNVTVSGDQDSVDILETNLINAGIFARKLKVNNAYHSPYMNPVANKYREAIGKLVEGNRPLHPTTLLSTVTGAWVEDAMLRTPDYWVNNMIKPVRFAPAVGQLTFKSGAKVWKKLDGSHRNHTKVTFFLEVGFHSALRGPLKEITEASGSQTQIPYSAILIRGSSPVDSLMSSMGHLFCHGYPVNLSTVNSSRVAAGRPKPLCDLPEYPFNHSQKYWEESRISQRFRLHPQGVLDLLGKPSPDWNENEAKWRNHLRVSQMPWMEDHKINNTILYPGAGMLVMAIEAANQLSDANRTVEGFQLKDVQFLSALIVPSTSAGIETNMSLRQIQDKSSSETPWMEFRIFSFVSDEWKENCRGCIQIQYEAIHEGAKAFDNHTEELKICSYQNETFKSSNQADFQPTKLYETLKGSGYGYGPSFQLLRSGGFSDDHNGIAEVQLYEWPTDAFPQPHIIHPCTLDAILHTTIAAFTENGKTKIPTAIPSSLRKMWIAKQGLSYPEADQVKASTWMTEKHSRGTECSMSVIDKLEKRVLIQIDGLNSTVVADTAEANQSLSEQKQTCYYLSWKPDMTMTSKEKVSTYCQEARIAHPEPTQFFEDLTFVLLSFLTKAVNELSADDVCSKSPHFSRYLDWCKHELSRYHQGTLPHTKAQWARDLTNSTILEEKCQRVETENGLGRAYVATGRNLVSIIRGDIEPLQFLFESDLLKGLYYEINQNRACFAELNRFLDAVGHKNPRVKILEIGAGTGGTTSEILSAFYSPEHSTTSRPKYSSYTYTDISPSFFEAAQALFKEYPNMDYQVLDISIDPATQGFNCGTFDIVIASNVLHATEHIEQTVRNARKLLRDGGRIILYESVRPEILRTGFIMGLLPGWWVSSEEARKWAPTMNSDSWDKTLRKNCFSGIDLELPDFLDPQCREGSIIISTAEPIQENVPNGNGILVPSHPDLVIVLDPNSKAQKGLAHLIQSSLAQGAALLSLVEAAQMNHKEDLHFIFLEEIDNPCLEDLSQAMFISLREILNLSKGVLWVTNGRGQVSENPGSSMASGLFRVLRNERLGRPCATLALDWEGVPNDHQIEAIGQILEMFKQDDVDFATVDIEFFEKKGLFHIPRVVQDDDLSEELFQGSLPRQRKIRMHGDCPPLQLTVESPGFLDTIGFTEDDAYANPLDDDEVEVEVQAMGLNFRDVLLALGRMPESDYGTECSGFVSRAGSKCSFKPGDRVVSYTAGTFKTYARAKAEQVIKIDENMSFTEAASIPTQFCTAWQAVHELGRLKKGESILIHAAAGGTGQAAIQVAQSVGGIVYTTVSSQLKRDVLRDVYHIPEDHIFFSRDLSFSKGIMMKTKGRGVDVVLNSLAGDSLVAGWECIAPYGRFIEIGKKDILSNAKLPMYPFRRNTSFICFDGFTWQTDHPEDSRRTFEQVLEHFQSGRFHCARPLNVFSAEKIEDAFRSMQDGKMAGKVVIEIDSKTQLRTILATQPSFYIDSDSTYVIAGGLGGLGRSIARWLVDRGARNLVLLSRSGASNETSQIFMEELKAREVNAIAPACNIGDLEALKNVFEICSQTLPPIKGCVQASMVLRDVILETMNYSDWRVATDCKVAGSWNLHKLLPQDLHFFILLSSVSGIVGVRGQANYAAGSTYLDALARYRVSRGQRAVSVDLGALIDDGVLAEDPKFLEQVLSYGALTGISRSYFYSMLDYYCNPDLPLLSTTQSQPLLGLGLGAGADLQGIELAQQSMFSQLNSNSEDGGGTKEDAKKQEAWSQLFSIANSRTDATHIISQAFIAKLQKTLSALQGEVDMYRPLAAYGVDSLLAVELRSWISKEFKADVAMFEISGGASLSTLSALVASRSKIQPEGWS